MGCHFLLQGNLSDAEIELASPAWEAYFFTTEPPAKTVMLNKYFDVCTNQFSYPERDWTQLTPALGIAYAVSRCTLRD